MRTDNRKTSDFAFRALVCLYIVLYVFGIGVLVYARGFESGSKSADVQTEGAYRAVVERVIDGDTFVASIDLPLDVTLRHQHVRILGIDAPEIGTPEGQNAKHALEEMLKSGAVAIKPDGRDSFGRVLAVVLVEGRDVASHMIKNGFAEPYKP